MKSQIINSTIQYHNNYQLDYFSQSIKKTMIPTDSYYVLNHVKKMIDYAGITRNERILEVGCGMGKFTIPMVRDGFKVTGLDLSPFLLQQLLKYNDNRFEIPLIATDILDAPKELNQTFDHVIGFFTLHHFHNLHICYQAMSRLVKPGGSLTFIEPNAFNPLYYLQISFSPGMSWKGEKGILKMQKSSIAKATDYSALNNLQVYRYGFFPPMIIKYKWAQSLEQRIERWSLFNSILPFSIFKATKPLT